jgi:hypothetical protein
MKENDDKFIITAGFQPEFNPLLLKLIALACGSIKNYGSQSPSPSEISRQKNLFNDHTPSRTQVPTQ